MEAHTPKRYAIENFINQHSAKLAGWQIRIVDEKDSPVVRLQAVRTGETTSDPGKTLEIHTRQSTVAHEEIDESTKTMIRKWLASL